MAPENCLAPRALIRYGMNIFIKPLFFDEPRSMKKKMTMLVVAAALMAIVLLVSWHTGLFSFFQFGPSSKRVAIPWECLGAVPRVGRGCTPQGMAWTGDRIIFASSVADTESILYECHPDDMRILRSFKMEKEAVHVSGLAYDGRHLWAVDYVSNRCYKLDLEASFQQRRAVVLGHFATGLKGTSACCLLKIEGRDYLAISDFMRTRKTYIVDHEAALARGTMSENIVFAYRNEGFSQGLEWDGRYLYESENKAGVDVINQMDFAVLRAHQDARAATVRQFNAPGKAVEDIAFDGERLYTSDERDFMFHRTAAVLGDRE